MEHEICGVVVGYGAKVDKSIIKERRLYDVFLRKYVTTAYPKLSSSSNQVDYLGLGLNTQTTGPVLAKYAICSIGPTADLPKVPLSPFIAEDMNELVYAHASYRLSSLRRRSDRGSSYLWLFKPSMRLAYATPMRYIIPKAGAIHAAKVLDKILPPTTVYSELQTITSKYLGFHRPNTCTTL
ncbi:hypothetical protein B0H21DRAFT_822046 [Amylocystis lapponica]|nr:hypothetical protein B0H21DRAFT_822046 [Amylocystis lapponica]